LLSVTEELKKLAVSLEKRVISLEGGQAKSTPVAEEEDVDLFGSSDEEDEEKTKVDFPDNLY